MSRTARIAWVLAGLAIALHLVGHLFVVLGIGTATPADERRHPFTILLEEIARRLDMRLQPVHAYQPQQSVL